MDVQWIIDRLSEASTWAGFAGILGGAAVFGLSTDAWMTIGGVVMSILSAFAVVKKEKGW